ncbi:MAG TPA: alpha/beta hydrolase [Candidatus Thermoplasmatota archaeon]|nr:alpha/beta hydrolase [Candidatus Thermoplasmatota archaeon]
MAEKPHVATGSLYDQGQRVRAGGLDTWVVRAGPRGGAPAVFLHGIPTSAYAYRDVIRAMHEERDCVAFDWPGFGSSDKPRKAAYTHRSRADHLLAVLDALGLARADLVAHDVAGPAALLLLVERPERVRRLVLLNTTVYRRDYRPPLPALAQFVPVLRQVSRPFLTRQTFDFFFRQGLARPQRVPRAVLETHWRLARAHGGRDTLLEAWAQLPDGAAEIEAIRAKLGEVKAPTLVLFGADDTFLPPPNAERLAKAIPGARLQLLANAGHFVMEDAPEVVAERISAFLDEGS